MTDHSRQRRLRRAAWSATLLASTMMTGVGAAMAAPAPGGGDTSGGVSEVIVTAQKRSEDIQKVPMSIQAIDERKLSQLNVTELNDYVKFMPSVSFQNSGPNTAQIYMRGVSSGDNGNHSGPLPTVGTYLDEMPITTIGGTLDVHVYDIARVEVLPGPQGTLYGASSEAGTMRIITNKPSTSGFSAGYDVQGNTVDHGGQGYVAEGFVNIPLAANAAIRLVAFDQHDAGYIDNVAGTRTFYTANLLYGPAAATINNAAYVKKAFNTTDSYGGRAALKIDLNDSWTVEPTIMGQDLQAKGVFGYEPSVGYLQTQRFQPDTDHDRWGAATMAINGKLGKYSLVYAGSYFVRQVDSKTDYTDYSIFYDQGTYHSGHYWLDSGGNPLAHPQQEIFGTDKFTKQSHELRIASPSTDRFRIIAGLFTQRQTHWIIQDYQIQGFGTQLQIPGWPNTIWLTDQMRIDKDDAAFGEASFDITPALTVTAGIRAYDYRNSLKGFYGFSENYDAFTGFHSGMGSTGQNCLSADHYRGDPCVNLNKTVTGHGETHKVNLTYKLSDTALFYATYSTGFRPGGVNRNGNFGGYSPDTLNNYELGWKTSLFDKTVRFNGAVYYEEWKGFQYAFLGPNSLTIIENGPDAGIKGIESTVDWRATDHLNLSFNGAYNDAKMLGVLCKNLGENPCLPGDVAAPKGRVLPYTPAFKGNLTARYAFDIGSWNAHAQGAVLFQTKNEVGLRDVDIASLGDIPAYATADVSFGAEKDRMSAELFVKNLFNTRAALNNYIPCGFFCTVPQPGIPAPRYVVPVQPLTVGVKFGQKF